MFYLPQMKPSFFFILLLFLIPDSNAQEQLTPINASIIYFQGADTVDMKNPRLGLAEINFAVKSRIKIITVAYEITIGRGTKVVSTETGTTNNNVIVYNRARWRLRTVLF
jgi:hypothetical protein